VLCRTVHEVASSSTPRHALQLTPCVAVRLRQHAQACYKRARLRACLLVSAGEVLSERLTVRPLSAGWLRVLGVSWVLAGTAEGYVEFDIKGRRRKRPKGDRCAHSARGPAGASCGWLASTNDAMQPVWCLGEGVTTRGHARSQQEWHCPPG
jgi:hypothetical protein